MPRSRWTTASCEGIAISTGFTMGPFAWSSRSAARPSQNCSLAKRRLMTVGLLPDALGGGVRIGEPVEGDVAGGAGDRAVLRESWVEVEEPAERDLVRGERVLVGNVGGPGLEAERQLEGEGARAQRLGERRGGEHGNEEQGTCHASPYLAATAGQGQARPALTAARGRD